MEIKRNIILWCGNAPNHKALANKVYQRFGLAGIVIDQKKSTGKKKRQENLLFKLWDNIRFKKINNAWKRMQKFYQAHYSKWPDVPLIEVPNINSEKTLDFCIQGNPDLVVVSGTAMVKEPLLNLRPGIGIMNLHTGLSPYVKGGPNCTNWCISNDQWNFTGNTIMWINSGIDTGNIITSEVVDIRDCPTLYAAHKKVMEHAHDLYLRAISYIIHHEPPYPSIPQNSLGTGNLFMTKMWNDEARKKLLKNWAKRAKAELKNIPETINLPPDH